MTSHRPEASASPSRHDLYSALSTLEVALGMAREEAPFLARDPRSWEQVERSLTLLRAFLDAVSPREERT